MPRGSTIPSGIHFRDFELPINYGTSVDLNFYYGDRLIAEDNEYIGTLILPLSQLDATD